MLIYDTKVEIIVAVAGLEVTKFNKIATVDNSTCLTLITSASPTLSHSVRDSFIG